MTKEKLKNRVLNGSRGSGKSLRLLIEVYENQIEDLKADHKHNLELMKGLNDKIAKLKKELRHKEKVELVLHRMNVKRIDYAKQLDKARKLIETIIRVTWGEGWNYSLDWKVKAEQFIKEIEK